MNSVLTLGGVTRDIFLQSSNGLKAQTVNDTAYLLIPEGTKFDVQDIQIAVGGGAANSAVSFRRLEFKVSSFFKTGDDEAGRFIRQTLAHEGIDVARAGISAQKTALSCIIPAPSGNHAIFVYRGANATLEESDIPFELIKQHTVIHITSLAGKSGNLLATIASFAKKNGLLVANNPGSSQTSYATHTVQEALPFIDILLVNTAEAQKLMQGFDVNQDFSIKDFCSHILSQGPRIVVVTAGAKGAYVASKEQFLFCPSIKTSLVSTVGAGDAFGSCFVAYIASGYSLEEAAHAGVLNSAAVIKHLSAQAGLLKKSELQAQLKNFICTCTRTVW